MNFSAMPSLLDPATCGEDIARIPATVRALAFFGASRED
jgi:hypothetical protein